MMSIPGILLLWGPLAISLVALPHFEVQRKEVVGPAWSTEERGSSDSRMCIAWKTQLDDSELWKPECGLIWQLQYRLKKERKNLSSFLIKHICCLPNIRWTKTPHWTYALSYQVHSTATINYVVHIVYYASPIQIYGNCAYWLLTNNPSS